MTRDAVAQQFKTNDLKTKLDADCLRVLENFELPAQRLLCFFDDEDPHPASRSGSLAGTADFTRQSKGAAIFLHTSRDSFLIPL
jgi:hypothetical protein